MKHSLKTGWCNDLVLSDTTHEWYLEGIGTVSCMAQFVSGHCRIQPEQRAAPSEGLPGRW